MGALVSVYIFVAGRGVSYSYTVAGQRTIESGAPAALRIGVYDIYRGRFLPRAQVDVALVQGETSTLLFEGTTSPDGFAHANLMVPPVPPGPAAWRVTMKPIDMGSETVEIDVNIVDGEGHDTMVPWTDAAALIVAGVPAKKKQEGKDAGVSNSPEPDDRIRIDLVPESHTATDGLRSVLFVSTTDASTGAPVSATVEFELVKGMVDGKVPKRIVTNRGGLAAVSLVPIGAQQWRTTVRTKRINAEGLESQDTQVDETAVDSELKQYSIVLGDTVWEANETLELGVRTLHRSGGVYVDVYQDGRWRYGQVAGIGSEGSGFAIHDSAIIRPTEGVWLAQIQTYGQSLQPANAVEARTVAVVAPNVTPEQTLRVILDRAAKAGVRDKTARALLESKWLSTASSREIHAQISFWLAQLPTQTRDPHLLLDTQQGERNRLADEKETLRSSITTLLIVSGGLGLLLILTLVIVNLLSVRRTSEQMILELAEMDLPEVDDVGEPLAEVTNLARKEGVFQLVFLFVTIALFFAAIVILLQHL